MSSVFPTDVHKSNANFNRLVVNNIIRTKKIEGNEFVSSYMSSDVLSVNTIVNGDYFIDSGLLYMEEVDVKDRLSVGIDDFFVVENDTVHISGANNTNKFYIRDAVGTSIFNVDTTNGLVNVNVIEDPASITITSTASTLDLNSGTSTTVNAGSTFDVNSGTSTAINAGSTLDLNSTTSSTWTAGTSLDVTAPTVSFDTSTLFNVTGNVQIAGDLTVIQNPLTIIPIEVAIVDPQFHIALDNPTDALDTGFYISYNQSTAERFDGFMRSQSNGEWYLYRDEVVEPSSVMGIPSSLATLNVNGVQAATLSATTSITTPLVTTTGVLTLNGDTGVNVTGNASEIDITTTGLLDMNAGIVTLDSSTNMNLTSGGAMTLDSGTSNMTLDTTGDVHVTSASTLFQNKVGIGPATTADIDELLHIEAATGTPGLKIQSTVANGTARMRLQNDARLWDLQVIGSSSDKFAIRDDTANANRMLITSNGYVGVGPTLSGLNQTRSFEIAHPTTTASYVGHFSLTDTTTTSLDFLTKTGYYNLQTNANVGLAFTTNNAANESIIINTSGRVGIGGGSAVTPLAQLTVTENNADVSTSGTSTNAFFRLNSNSGNSNVLDMGLSTFASNAYIQSTDRADLSLSYPLLLNPNGGTVGIGTETTTLNASTRLHINQNADSNLYQMLRLENPSTGTSARCGLTITGGANEIAQIYVSGSGHASEANNMYIVNKQAANLSFGTSNTPDRMVMDASGNVSMSNNLTVSGGNVFIGSLNALYNVPYNSINSSSTSITGTQGTGLSAHNNILTLIDTSDSAGTGGTGGGIGFVGTYRDFGPNYYGLAGRIRGVTDTGQYGGGLIFETVSSGSTVQAITITSLGNVGIGTTSPQVRLDVRTTNTTTPTVQNIMNQYTGQNLSVGDYTIASLLMGNGNHPTYYNAGIHVRIPKNAYGDACRLDFTTPQASNDNTQITRMSIMPFTGEVLFYNTSGSEQIQLQPLSGTANLLFQNGSGSVNVTGSHPLTFATDNTGRMTIDSSGNVGIDETTPLALLQVGKTNNNSAVENTIRLSGYKLGAGGEDYATLLFANELSGVAKITARRIADNFGTVLDFKVGTPNGAGGTSANSATVMSVAYNSVSTGNTSTTFPAINIISSVTGSGALYFNDGANSGALIYDHTNEWTVIRAGGTNTVGVASGILFPYEDDLYDLGTASRRWDDLWLTSGTFLTSDVNVKENIVSSALGLDFINQLEPVSFKFKDYTSTRQVVDEKTGETQTELIEHTHTRTHYGLIAQQVKTVMDNNNLTVNDFAGWGYDTLENGTTRQSLRYNEFISPMIKAIQELSSKINDLTARLKVLENP